jgi:hypothetical protein
MKKYIFYTLLLVTFVVSNNSYADTDNFPRTSVENSSQQTARKSFSASSQTNLGSTEPQNIGEVISKSAVRDNSAGTGRDLDSEDLNITSETSQGIFISQDAAEDTTPSRMSLKRRIAEIKADGIISADEVSDYETIKIRSDFGGNLQLPVLRGYRRLREPGIRRG